VVDPLKNIILRRGNYLPSIVDQPGSERLYAGIIGNAIGG